MIQTFKQGAIASACALALGGALAAPGRPAPASTAPSASSYIVQLADAPAASYRGGLKGLAATQVAEGARLRAGDSAVRAYVGHLQARRNALLAALGGVKPLHTYDYIFNGFSARLTDAQVQRLRRLPGVVAVTHDVPRQVATNHTPAFLGLDGPEGVWTRLAHHSAQRGEDIIIGVVDLGVQPEDPSFSDRQDALGNPTFGPGTVVYGPPPARWTGGCITATAFDPAKHCNHKLIGAKAFDAGFVASGLPRAWDEYEGSPRDMAGHGSHTASTAGGNQGVITDVGKISGMAPRARLAIYKACWDWFDDVSGINLNNCWTTDTVAAMDAAVADGVDILNYSISGSMYALNDPVELAFLNVAAAGVFVSAAAGNWGPENSVTHPSPWVTSVAATTDGYTLEPLAAKTRASGKGRAAAASAEIAPDKNAPVLTEFSARGPNLAVTDVIKPDLAAPGLLIMAATAMAVDEAGHDAIVDGSLVPTASAGYQDGTSMSAAHISGIAALLKQRWPSMSPAKIKSALMTTASRVNLPDGSPDPDLNGYGAGHVNVAGALDPGLVYPINPDDYHGYLCGKNVLPTGDPLCKDVAPLPGAELNLPSFSSDVAGTVTFKRRVRNLGPAGRYTASVSVPGFDATVTPSTLAVDAKGSAKYTLTLKANGSAPMDVHTQGSVSWSDGHHVVRSPVLVRPVLFSGPAELSSDLGQGQLEADYQYGYAGAATHSVGGLIEATRNPGTVLKSPVVDGNVACSTDAVGTTKFVFPVLAGTLVSRFATYDAETGSAGLEDFDMFVYDSAGRLQALSGSWTAGEMVTLLKPEAGDYTVCIHGFKPADGVSTSFTLSSWIVAPGGTLEAKGVPSTVALGQRAKVGLSWKDAAAGKRYLGALDLMRGTDPTIVRSLGVTVVKVEPGVPAGVMGLGGGNKFSAPRTAR